MKKDIVQHEILGDVKKFLKPGVKSATHNGSIRKKIDQHKAAFVEAFSEEALEVGAGIVVTGLVSAVTGGTVLLPGAIGFGTAVAMNSYRKVMSHQHQKVMQHVANPYLAMQPGEE